MLEIIRDRKKIGTSVSHQTLAMVMSYKGPTLAIIHNSHCLLGSSFQLWNDGVTFRVGPS